MEMVGPGLQDGGRWAGPGLQDGRWSGRGVGLQDGRWSGRGVGLQDGRWSGLRAFRKDEERVIEDLPYEIVVRLARRLMKLGRWEPKVEGAENIPLDGPAVLAANHISYLDFIFAAWGAVFERRRYVRFLAKKEVFDATWSGWIMRAMKHIPVDRKKDPGKAMDPALRALGEGQVVAAFLEGSVNKTLIPGRGKTGAVRMAQATGAPLIPMALWGTHRIWSEREGDGQSRRKRHRLSPGTPVIVKIGPAVEIKPSEDPREATDRVMEVIRELLAHAQKEDLPG